jgi:putative Holliday junction resolvase
MTSSSSVPPASDPPPSGQPPIGQPPKNAVSPGGRGKGAKAAVPKQGRLLGIDYGTRRLGFAVSDPAQTMSAPIENYTRGDLHQDARMLKRLLEEYRPVGVVIGLPVHMSGQESGKSKEARSFGTWVAQTTGLPVAYWDERYSSAIAEEYLLSADLSKKGRDKRRDMMAAHILLRNYLQARDRQAAPPDLRDPSEL